jgi:hypothetical protein
LGYGNVTLVITDTMQKQVVSVHEHEDGESQVLQNVVTFLQNYSASHHTDHTVGTQHLQNK